MIRFFKIKCLVAFLAVVFAITGCSTYYQKSKGTEKAIVAHDYELAEKEVKTNKFLSRKRNQLLYYLELGKIQHLQGHYEASNQSLNTADNMMESFRNIFEMAVGVTVNPSMQVYNAEPHELIMVHYYKALNYLRLGNTEEALVEARRLDLSLNKNKNAVNGKEKKYGTDPFGLMLMGMIYEAAGDYNNAFIAYRNAKEAYEKDETQIFSSNYPYSLDADLAKMANYANMPYNGTGKPTETSNGELILFWENGLAPIKEEKNMFFSLDKKDGEFFFASDDLYIPVDYDFSNGDDDFNPSDIGIIRLAWSHYVPRPPMVQGVNLTHNGEKLNFQLIEDVSALAFQVERDRYFQELAKNLIRIAIKKISELSIAEKNEYAGLAMGIANAATEKADTRNWQSLPNKIYYTRIPLKKGENIITVRSNAGEVNKFTVQGNGNILFRNVITY